MDEKSRKARLRQIEDVMALEPGDDVWIALNGSTEVFGPMQFERMVNGKVFLREHEKSPYPPSAVHRSKIDALRACLRGIRSMVAHAHKIEERLRSEISAEKRKASESK